MCERRVLGGGVGGTEEEEDKMKASSHETEALQWVPLTMPTMALQSRCAEHENDLSMCSRGFEFEKIKYWCRGGASLQVALAPPSKIQLSGLLSRGYNYNYD